jgi:hypothetical protein
MRRSNNRNNLSTPTAGRKGASSFLLSVRILVILAIFCISVFAGCDTTTGTRTAMRSGALSKIDNLDVQVSVDRDFSVTLSGAKPRSLDEVHLILTSPKVIAIASVVISDSKREAEDAKRALAFRSTVAEIHAQSIAGKALVDGLQASRRFVSVTAVSEPQEIRPADSGILRVRIENWGLYADSRENAALDQVQVGLNATAQLVGAGGKRIWEHTDYFTSGLHRPISEYGSSPDLLKSEMEETIRRYCARVVNEIRYAQ